MTEQIQIAEWANVDAEEQLTSSEGPFSLPMCNSDGTGKPLLKLGDFGADIIYFEAGRGVQTHVHDGDHILFVLRGEGFVEYNGLDHALRPGLCYLIPGLVDHAIKATSALTLIAVGNRHVAVDSKQRMVPVKRSASISQINSSAENVA